MTFCSTLMLVIVASSFSLGAKATAAQALAFAAVTPTPTIAPDSLQPLTVSNIGEITEISQWGKGRIDRLAQTGPVLMLLTPFDLYFYDTEDQSEIAAIPDVLDFIVTPDQKVVLTTSPLSTTIKSWNIADGTSLRTYKNDLTPPKQPPADFSEEDYYRVRATAFSPDGKSFAASYGDNSIVLWGTQNGNKEKVLTANIAPPADEMAFSPDGQFLATSGDILAWWSLGDGKILYRQPGGGHLSANPFSPDGKMIVTSDEGYIWVRSIPSGKMLHTYRTSDFGEVEFSADGKYLIIGGGSEVRQVSNGKRLPPAEVAKILPTPVSETEPAVDLSWLEKEGHLNGVQGLAGQSATDLIVYGIDGSRAFWQNVLNNEMGSTELPGTPLNRMAAAWDGSQLGVCMSENLYLVKQAGEPQKLDRCREKGYLAFSPDGETLARAYSTQVNLINLLTGKTEHNLIGNQLWVTVVNFSPDGSLVATGTPVVRNGAQVFIWKTDPLSLVAKYRVTSDSIGDTAVTALAFSPDNKLIAIGGADYHVKLLRVSDGWLLEYPSVEGRSISLAFSPDSKLLASGDLLGNIHVWDTLNGDDLAVLSGHAGPVVGLMFSADGKNLISASEDGTVRLWGIP
jgi:WD40 repeat protein